MGIQGIKLLKAIAATAGYVLVLGLVYVAHARWFRVDVVFYSALLDVAIASAVCGLLLWGWRYFSPLGALEKLLLTVVWLLMGYAYAISIPTVIDRSLSFYLLEKLDQRGGGIRLDAMQRVIDDEFMREYRVLDARLTEQVESGTIGIRDGCVVLTERGSRIAAFSRFFRATFLPRQRQLRGEYSDALTAPFRESTTDVDYGCR